MMVLQMQNKIFQLLFQKEWLDEYKLKHIINLIKDESKDLEDQKTFVLGRRILEDGKCVPSFFEMVLAKPGMESLITTIRKKFSLSKNDEMLQIVSKSDFKCKKSDFD
jgi:hypothetical protein